MHDPVPASPTPGKVRAAGAHSQGATEEQVNMTATVPQRLDKKGSKIEDQAGTGDHDSQGG